MTTRRDSIRRAPIRRLVVAGAAIGALCLPALMVAPASAKTKTVTVSTAKTSKGTVLVSNGRTLYTLQPSTAPCDAVCLQIWPALVVPSGMQGPTAGKGVKQAALGVTTTSSGGHQVTYNGAALFWYSGDQRSGQVNGNIRDQWGTWVAAAAASGTSSGGSSNTGGGSSNTGGSGGSNNSNSGGTSSGSGGASF
jgi:predicted lipoprotein with Yx(FWY)xxD motif